MCARKESSQLQPVSMLHTAGNAQNTHSINPRQRPPQTTVGLRSPRRFLHRNTSPIPRDPPSPLAQSSITPGTCILCRLLWRRPATALYIKHDDHRVSYFRQPAHRFLFCFWRSPWLAVESLDHLCGVEKRKSAREGNDRAT